MNRPTFTQERLLLKAGFKLIAGVDEVGTGAWAGPVVAAAVIFKPRTRIDFIRDSKVLTPHQRVELATKIKKRALAWRLGYATPEEIALWGLRRATLEAMRQAVMALHPLPQAVLADAFHIPGLPMFQQAIVRGDRKVRTIAAASIIAKVHRDKLMQYLDRKFPGYGFAAHKGYGTKAHLQALKRLGPSPVHRHSYAVVRGRK
jgi:ribonuclease HII